jgi:ubiquinone/menaquinone biosynthesis C-methylase UbiE
MDSWYIVIRIGGLLFILLVLYWLLIITEGTFLGAKSVALMYNLVARRYDGIKSFDPIVEDFFLCQPITTALNWKQDPQVLDVATGTGRVPRLLMASGNFNGRVVGLDYAREMLSVAAKHMETIKDHDRIAQEGKAYLIWQNAMRLPFPDNAFDLVTCLEALEFMPNPNRVIEEMVRVLKPGHAILLTRRRGWERRFMPGKTWSKQAFFTKLSKLGLTQLKSVAWQKDYDLVWAHKPDSGNLSLATAPLGISLYCPLCSSFQLLKQDGKLICRSCGCKIPIGTDGVIELAHSRKS